MHPLFINSPLYSESDKERRAAVAKPGPDHRDVFEIDRSRIIHCFAFRRLQSKTQIFGVNESAFLRTRLTHSLEASNIARAITASLNHLVWPEYPSGSINPAYASLLGPIDSALVETAALAHDLGHPPFGHRGEEALNYCIWRRWADRDNGFEGNGQTLRLLSNDDLEVHAERNGLNLCRATLLAILKYPATFGQTVNKAIFPDEVKCPPFRFWAPPKCIMNEENPILEWLLEPFCESDRALFTQIERRERGHGKTVHKTIEASIIELADDIAYGAHDVEDSFFAGLIPPETILRYMNAADFESNALYQEYRELITLMGTGGTASRREAVYEKKRAASAIIARLINAVELAELPEFENPHLRWRAVLPHDHSLALKALKSSVYEKVITGPAVQSLEFRGGIIVRDLFEAYYENPELLGGRAGYRFRDAASNEERLRVLADQIAGMTDDFAEMTWRKLFQPGSGSVFDKR